MGTIYSRNRSFLSLLVFLPIACSTVQKLEEPPRTIQEPYYRALGENPGGFLFRESESDYKIRKSGHEKPVLAFSPVSYPKSVDKKLVAYFEQEIGIPWREVQFSGVKIPADIWSNPDALLAAAKNAEVDAFVQEKVVETDNGWVFQFSVIDPINGFKFGEFEGSFKRPLANSEDSGSWSQVFFWKAGDRIISLDARKATVPVWERKLFSSEIKEIISSTVRGKLNIRASSGDTDVFHKGVHLGKTPQLDFSIGEGLQEVEFHLKGKKPVVKTVLVRAGKRSSIFQEWEEDKTLGSAKIVSVPAGLSVSVDGFKQGETPFFRSGLNPGNYQIELIKDNPEGSLVYYESTLEVKSDKVTEIGFPYSGGSLLSETEFWKGSGEVGFNPFGIGNLEFTKNKNLPSGWNGVYSLPIPADELEIIGNFLLPSDHKSGTVAITFHGPGFNLGFEAGPEKVSVFHFPSEGKTVGSYKYLKLENDVGRAFSFRTDAKEKRVRLYLGNDMVWEGQISFQGFWTISILTKGDDFKEHSPLKDLKIQYRGYK
ncbi:PEGA domain-containing protein [Leptospira fletcheri]|uniref:PEGA domain-containing protein n=1 Tax=Leptospira fletcheri TaxID=2484981 RepID=A0A4R9GGF5_9LEPT|nr:PEGA domain-containing protein [Leptospira fletcheri]TGK11784.1 PEGA domain-containing protein [Leptospira fletcheri]